MKTEKKFSAEEKLRYEILKAKIKIIKLKLKTQRKEKKRDSGGSAECSRRTSHGIVSSQKIEGSSVENSREPDQNQAKEASE